MAVVAVVTFVGGHGGSVCTSSNARAVSQKRAADAAMKQGKWEKKKFLGEEVRDKTLGLMKKGCFSGLPDFPVCCVSYHS